MGSYIKIDSISIDLANSIDKSDAGKCEHFSIRGYVSEIRKREWKICWPFPLLDKQTESEEQPSLLSPIDVPKFRWWCCQNCQREIASGSTDKDDRTDFNFCSAKCRSDSNSSDASLRSDVLPAPKPDSFKRREIDLNNSTNVSGGNDCSPIKNEEEKKAEVIQSRTIVHGNFLKDNLNHPKTSVSSEAVYPNFRQEEHTNDRGNEVAHVELAACNLKCTAKTSAGIYDGGTPISAYYQCQKGLCKAYTALGDGKMITESDNITDHTTGHPPQESDSSYYDVLDSLIENDALDHHAEQSTGLPRRRPRKVRLLIDLLSENNETKAEQINTQGSPLDCTSNVSATLETLSISQGKVDVQGDLTNIDQSRKMKFHLDEELKSGEIIYSWRVDNGVQNLEGDPETIGTVHDQGSEDVLAAGIGLQGAVKSYCIKPETERRQTMGNNNRKIQFFENHLISETHQGYQKKNGENMNGADTEYASKTVSSRLTSHAFADKLMDDFSLHALRAESESKLSKVNGKMLQVDGELASSSFNKDDMLVDFFAHRDTKIISNMPVVTPIPSAHCDLNENGLEEGLHLSLDSYLAAQVYNNKCNYQIETGLPFSMPLQEGTSKVHQLITKDRGTNVVGEPSIPSKHITDAISGKGVHCEVITSARNTEKTANALKQVGITQNYGDQTVDNMSKQGTVDDIPMEILELMAKNQYERCLPDAENRNCLLEISTVRRKARMTVGVPVYGKRELRLSQEGQSENTKGRHRKNGMVVRGANLGPRKRKPVPYFSLFDENHSNMNSLCKTQSLSGVEVSQFQKKPSSGFHFSPMVTSQLGSAQNCKLNENYAECGCPNAALLAQGQCSLHKTILQHTDEASRIWASFTPNHFPLGYDLPKKALSQSTSVNMDTDSLQSGSLYKQNTKKSLDLDYLNFSATDTKEFNRNIRHGTFSRMNSEYPFPCKHSGIGPHQNLRGSLDLYSNEMIPAMHLLSLMDAGFQSGIPLNAGVSAQMLKRPSNHVDCITKLENDVPKPLNSLKRPFKSCFSDRSHGCFLGSPTFGASSSIKQDGKFDTATDFNGRIFSKSGKKGKKKSSNSARQNRGNKQFSWSCLESETPPQCKLEVHGTCGTLLPVINSSGWNTCNINRNPADFTMPDSGNVFMIRGEDLKFKQASIPKNWPGLLTLYGCKQLKKLKQITMKEHEKH